MRRRLSRDSSVQFAAEPRSAVCQIVGKRIACLNRVTAFLHRACDRRGLLLPESPKK
jgi:hypothetical protein